MNTLRRILCAVDFSEVFQRTLAHAVALAARHDAEVTVLHVNPAPVPVPAGPLDHARASSLDRGGRERWTADVRRFSERLGHARLEVTIVEGVVDIEILAAAARLHADLVCMGTHGRSGFERWVLGSVADKVLRKARLPVMTVAPRCEPASAERAYRRILCAVDLTASSAFLVDYAAGLARTAGGDTCLTVLNCVEDSPGDDVALLRAGCELRPYRRYREEQARTRLAELAALHDPGLRIELAVATGSAWRAILHRAEEYGEGLIVIGANADEGLAAHLGSITDRVVREAACPVLTLRTAGSRP